MNHKYLAVSLLATATATVSGVAMSAGTGFPDTGQNSCVGIDGMENCTVSNSGDSSSMPRQDGRFGRDAAASVGRLNKIGVGDAGFDFTKVCNSGNLAGEGDCPVDPALGTGPSDWGCTKDNVTGLIWEVKVNDRSHLRDSSWSYTWYDPSVPASGQPDVGQDANSENCLDRASCDTDKYIASVNAMGMCGASDWRLPSKRELESLVHMGKLSPTIDVSAFPNTAPKDYWTRSSAAAVLGDAWVVGFFVGRSNKIHKQNEAHIRLVRGGKF